MFEDNTSTIAATQNPVAHSKLKHLETVYHQIRDFIADGKVSVTHIETEYQLADLLTKNQPVQRHHQLTNSIIQILPAVHANVCFG
jgi:F0F1-type ATP synthase gamma subunit